MWITSPFETILDERALAFISAGEIMLPMVYICHPLLENDDLVFQLL